MNTFRNLFKMSSVVAALVVAVLVFAPGHANFVQAQDDAPIVCDSTLAVLLLVAEHDYDYLSSMMDSEMAMPSLDLGQFDPLIHDIVAMMMEMTDDMDDEAMAEAEAMDMMLEPMMAMTTDEILAAWAASMNMEMADPMTALAPGNVAGEDPVCASVRADVERFLVAHIVTESEMMMDEE